MTNTEIETFDLVIIGAGPGGYNCAIRAGQLGLKVACIEKRNTLGGTCLNVGCIPSKSLLHSSELYQSAKTDFASHGIEIEGLNLNIQQMMVAKNDAINGLTQGVAYLLKKNKVSHFHGVGRIIDHDQVEIETVDGDLQVLGAKNIVIATGSEPATLPGIQIDENVIVSSTGALEFDAVPERLIVVGGGVIGLELGSVWSRLGSQVTVLEYADTILPEADQQLAFTAQKLFVKQGLDIKIGQKVLGARISDQKVTVEYQGRESEDAQTLNADRMIVAVGRRAFTEGLGLEAIGIETDQLGRIQADEALNVIENIWVIGDCTTGVMLAHKAEEEGVAVAERIAGLAAKIEHDLIPNVVYTSPEIAWVGETEESLKPSGQTYSIGQFPLSANSRSRANGQSEGFVKILADRDTDRILGVHILGPGGGELIAEACLAMAMSGSSEDLARTCHAHPTVSEAVRQAAMAVDDWAMQV